jgi:hypothetical protein
VWKFHLLGHELMLAVKLVCCILNINYERRDNVAAKPDLILVGLIIIITTINSNKCFLFCSR